MEKTFAGRKRWLIILFFLVFLGSLLYVRYYLTVENTRQQYQIKRLEISLRQRSNNNRELKLGLRSAYDFLAAQKTETAEEVRMKDLKIRELDSVRSILNAKDDSLQRITDDFLNYSKKLLRGESKSESLDDWNNRINVFLEDTTASLIRKAEAVVRKKESRRYDSLVLENDSRHEEELALIHDELNENGKYIDACDSHFSLKITEKVKGRAIGFELLLENRSAADPACELLMQVICNPPSGNPELYYEEIILPNWTVTAKNKRQLQAAIPAFKTEGAGKYGFEIYISGEKVFRKNYLF